MLGWKACKNFFDIWQTDLLAHSMARSHRLHHIHRVDHAPKRTHAWLVQVQRRGEITVRFFTDNLHVAETDFYRLRSAALKPADMVNAGRAEKTAKSNLGE